MAPEVLRGGAATRVRQHNFVLAACVRNRSRMKEMLLREVVGITNIVYSLSPFNFSFVFVLCLIFSLLFSLLPSSLPLFIRSSHSPFLIPSQDASLPPNLCDPPPPFLRERGCHSPSQTVRPPPLFAISLVLLFRSLLYPTLPSIENNLTPICRRQMYILLESSSMKLYRVDLRLKTTPRLLKSCFTRLLHVSNLYSLKMLKQYREINEISGFQYVWIRMELILSPKTGHAIKYWINLRVLVRHWE